MKDWTDALRRKLGLGVRAGEDAAMLYGATVEQARAPAFYADLGVADTPEGRFEMLCLHGFLVLNRLKAEGEAAEALGQALVNRLFLDLDRSLREMGVGDLTVGKRMKKMAQGFYGRALAYGEALDVNDEALLASAVARNVFADVTPTGKADERIAAYMRACASTLAGCDLTALRAGRLLFADIGATGGGNEH